MPSFATTDFATIGDVLAAYRGRHPDADVTGIERAYEVAEAAHRGQTRKSGEPYITHPLAVALVLADYGLDEATIEAALMHDVVEDTDVTLGDISAEFGSEVADLIDGVTKLDRLSFGTREAAQAATIRKMVVAMARDVRVLLIKLADRLHNVRTLGALPIEKQRRIAEETLQVYAPLATGWVCRKSNTRWRIAVSPLSIPARTPRSSRSWPNAPLSASDSSPASSPMSRSCWPMPTSRPRSQVDRSILTRSTGRWWSRVSHSRRSMT